MKQIAVYVAEDGSRFDSEDECRAYERQCSEIKGAMGPLGPEPRIGSDQFFQHSREACLAAKVALVAVFKELHPTWDLRGCPPEDVHPHGVVGRVIDDSSHRALRRAWSRLGRINWGSFREYEQPYFAMHPEKATEEVK